MSSTLNSMQIALINAGLLTAERAERVNTITKEQKRKAEKEKKLSKIRSERIQTKKPNQNKKDSAQKPQSFERRFAQQVSKQKAA